MTNKIQAESARLGFFKLPLLLVGDAVPSLPPTVTVPIIITPVPPGAMERMSFPTVILPPAVKVWPATPMLVMALVPIITLVCRVDGFGVGAGRV